MRYKTIADFGAYTVVEPTEPVTKIQTINICRKPVQMNRTQQKQISHKRRKKVEKELNHSAYMTTAVMMYSEFIEMSGKSESYISLTEYTEEIEPIYMNCDIPNKQEFIELFKDVFKKIVYPIVNNLISTMSIEDKLTYIHSESSDIENHIKLVDLQARKLAYQYMRLYLGV